MKNKRNQYLVNKKNGVVLKVKQYESNKKEEEKRIEMKKSLSTMTAALGVIFFACLHLVCPLLFAAMNCSRHYS